jgi:hypothetical protein
MFVGVLTLADCITSLTAYRDYGLRRIHSMAAAPRKTLLIFSLLYVAICAPPISSRPARQSGPSSLTVHEWGTFTSVAGPDGNAVVWDALNGSTDLPNFVEHLGGVNTKAGLQGTVRMETPVIYFYSPAETTVSVNVSFGQGLITEWYPHADRIKPAPHSLVLPNLLENHRINGNIQWSAVTVSPGLSGVFPHDEINTHYYAARETASSPVVVSTHSGAQQEKFLFYRGVSVAKGEISAQSAGDGTIFVRNMNAEPIPATMLFERRGEKIGYRIEGPLETEELFHGLDLTANMESLSHDMQAVLIAQGLYPDEARAMIATWQSSWFQEGARLFYIVPGQFLNSILPLSINPVPSKTVRVFVGRLEVITPATKRAVATALSNHDRSVIAKYERFLGPILDELKHENPERSAEIDRELSETYSVQLVEPVTK